MPHGLFNYEDMIEPMGASPSVGSGGGNYYTPPIKPPSGGGGGCPSGYSKPSEPSNPFLDIRPEFGTGVIRPRLGDGGLTFNV